MTEISQAEFIRYCCYLEQYPDVLATQWQELQTKSLEIYEAHQTAFAVLPENKRKNRYTDILPFDLTRVKLNIDEDDEMCSDYINASHIKGFSNNEYIATQGPLSHTVRDFWKMVIQENVSIIVMVARFYENKMEKCSKYFPNNHEIILFGDDIEVRCTTELNLNTYCVRTLEVRKGLKQQTVIHMQFVEWPDFGVPKGTDDLIYFCNQFRERWDAEGGRALVHCSAGVGRTGTIIATDILINSIKAGRKIDVFNTVLELRKQRKSMVQRQTQYLYIYQMIRCFLEEGGSYSLDTQEHIYENIQLAQDFRNKEEQSL
ncbi:receptor-type tyrosine-protein phosphatase O-like [Anthonomus grandis grandis]|uniref:receptor-type tyrosine-protein phosphatase O-like n=1 Tax=Anthonomus grandis grandis TaxID=2921223 RepID=UPI0021655724|nr:receptor-type tyrosine-protein phosphatase O-like [Anthonomus grandis grandis]